MLSTVLLACGGRRLACHFSVFTKTESSASVGRFAMLATSRRKVCALRTALVTSALYLGSSRCARPLPSRLNRPCRSSHSLHLAFQLSVSGPSPPSLLIRSTKSIPPALDANRWSVRASTRSRSTIWLDPTATALLRCDSRAEIRGDNCDSLRQK